MRPILLAALLALSIPASAQSPAEGNGKPGKVSRKQREQYLESAKSPDPLVRADIAKVLLWMDPPEVEAALALLSDPEPRVRTGTAQAFRNIDPIPDAAIEPLLKALEDVPGGLSGWATQALFNAHGNELRVARACMEIAGRKDSPAAAAACQVLSAHPGAYRDALRETLRKKTCAEMAPLMQTLRVSSDSNAMLALAEALRLDVDPEVRASAAVLIGLPHFDSPVVLPSLLKAATDDASARVRGSALSSLGKLGLNDVDLYESCLETYRAAFHDADAGARESALRSCAQFPRDAKRSARKLAAAVRELLKDEAESVRAAATSALKSLEK